jgi:hypothetical protein
LIKANEIIGACSTNERNKFIYPVGEDSRKESMWKTLTQKKRKYSDGFSEKRVRGCRFNSSGTGWAYLVSFCEQNSWETISFHLLFFGTTAKFNVTTPMNLLFRPRYNFIITVVTCC